MAGIFTREALNKIMADENMTPDQRTEAVYGLYGRALDDGFIAKSAAQQAQQTALDNAKTEWEKGIKLPDPKESDAYKQLEAEFKGYKDEQEAIASKDYEQVKPKFRHTVYGMIDRADVAKPVTEQLAEIRTNFDEYFVAEPATDTKKPQFGAPTEGTMPKGEEGAVSAFSTGWGFVPKKG